MEALKHLESYDMRRWTILEGITCRDCAYNRRKGCANAVAVLNEMRSRGNDMSIPAFDFTPDPDRRADQCPGMWPSDDYLAEIGATMREPLPVARPVSEGLVAELDRSIATAERIAAGEGKVGGMMEAKFVKGPYLRDGRTVYAFVPMLPQDQSKNGPKECNSFFCTVQGCNGKYSATEEQLEATAALFEAASEMLEVLEFIVGQASDPANSKYTFGNWICGVGFHWATEVIAKARGGAK